MIVKKYTDGNNDPQAQVLAQTGQRTWVGTETALDAAILAGTIPPGTVADTYVTEDGPEPYTPPDYELNKEVALGYKWIDGKQVYRIVLAFNNPKWDWTPNTFNVPGIGFIIKANFIAWPDYVNNPSFYWTESWSVMNNQYLGATINSARFLINTNVITPTTGSKVIWVIEYTKN